MLTTSEIFTNSDPFPGVPVGSLVELNHVAYQIVSRLAMQEWRASARECAGVRPERSGITPA